VAKMICRFVSPETHHRRDMMIENENINVVVRRQEWLMPSFVVVLYALLQAKFFIFMMNLKSFGLEKNAFVVFNVIFFLVFVLSAIIVWIILSLVCHWTALLFDGAADFKNFLFFSGYGFGAIAITYLVVLFVYMTGIPKGLAIEQMQQDESFNSALVLINIGFMMYYVWVVYAVYFLHKLSIAKSIASVACPMLLYFILTQLFSYI